MRPRKEEITEEPSTGTNDGWLRFERRPLLKALGVGSALSIGSGIVTAAGDESDETEDDTTGKDDEDDGSGQIDPVFGYPTTDPRDIPVAIEPDHEVELHRDFPDDPENPEHPSLFHFEPSGLNVSRGDIVQFTFTNPNHTVTAYHPGHGFQRRVPEEVPAFSAPIVQKDGAWLYRFEHEGLYDLYCGPHEIAGMAMRLVVGELAEDDVPDYEDTFEAEPPLIAPLSPEFLEHELNANSDRNENVEWVWPTDGDVLATDALDPMNIQEAGEVSFEAVADELAIAFEPEEDLN
jgi:plastocyanin